MDYFISQVDHMEWLYNILQDVEEVYDKIQKEKARLEQRLYDCYLELTDDEKNAWDERRRELRQRE